MTATDYLQILGPLIAAYLGSRLAVGHHSSTQWWEEKKTTYTSIVVHLLNCIKYWNTWHDDWDDDAAIISNIFNDQTHPTPSDAREVQFKESVDFLRRSAALGGWVISAEVAQILCEMRPDPIDKTASLRAKTQNEASAYRAALQKILKAAKADLGFRESTWQRLKCYFREQWDF